MPPSTHYFLLALALVAMLGLGPEAVLAAEHAKMNDRLNPEQWAQEQHHHRVLKHTPQYVLEHAPFVHLHSDERYWPSDMGEHLRHTTPMLNYTPVARADRRPSVRTLGTLNKYDGAASVYLQSENVVKDDKPDPAWITSAYGIPNPFEDVVSGFPETEGAGGRRRPSKPPRGRSAAPAVLVVVEKDDGIVDAFWFYFYSYNLGNTFFGIRFGNHVGDWEHSVVRFKNGKPIEVFLSEHAWGAAFTFDAMEKIGKRPVIYSGRGTHAMYARPGIQSYILPFSILHDTTDRGPLWDPTQNLYAYHYNTSLANGTDSHSSERISNPAADSHNTLSGSTLSPSAPQSWFYYGGAWGDKEWRADAKGQYRAPFVGDRHYSSGPRGPRFKGLGRKQVCPYDKCHVKTSIEPRNVVLRVLFDWMCACIIVWVLIGLGLLIWSCCRRCCGCCCDGRSQAGRDEEEGGRARAKKARRLSERTSLLPPVSLPPDAETESEDDG